MPWLSGKPLRRKQAAIERLAERAKVEGNLSSKSWAILVVLGWDGVLCSDSGGLGHVAREPAGDPVVGHRIGGGHLGRHDLPGPLANRFSLAAPPEHRWRSRASSGRSDGARMQAARRDRRAMAHYPRGRRSAAEDSQSNALDRPAELRAFSEGRVSSALSRGLAGRRAARLGGILLRMPVVVPTRIARRARARSDAAALGLAFPGFAPALHRWRVVRMARDR
jgi:hypothetical protein